MRCDPFFKKSAFHEGLETGLTRSSTGRCIRSTENVLLADDNRDHVPGKAQKMRKRSYSNNVG